MTNGGADMTPEERAIRLRRSVTELALLAVAALASAPPVPPQPPAIRDDRLLTAEEACARLGVTPRWLRRHRDLPFVRRLSRTSVRYSEAGLARWAARR